jgi:hypothetical protein
LAHSFFGLVGGRRDYRDKESDGRFFADAVPDIFRKLGNLGNFLFSLAGRR